MPRKLQVLKSHITTHAIFCITFPERCSKVSFEFHNDKLIKVDEKFTCLISGRLVNLLFQTSGAIVLDHEGRCDWLKQENSKVALSELFLIIKH
jgi:hypothetical protein